jgi:prefoldin alpha subunit
VTGKKKAIVGIGNRVSAEKDLDEAIQFMEVSVGEISKALRETISTLEEIDKMASDLTALVQNEYQNRQQPVQ